MDALQKLYIEYNDLLDSQCFIEDDLDYNVLEKHVPFLDKIDELSNSAIMIFDLFKRRHVYVSRNVSRIFHLDKEKATEPGSYIEEMTHSEDLIHLMEAGIYFLKYGFSVPLEQRKDGKLVNEYRIKSEEGKHIRLIEQQMCLETDLHGNIWLALGIMDISPDQDMEAPFRSRLINITNGDVFIFPPKIDSESSENKLTTREKEILSLIATGLMSKEIADKLCISVNTVNTHRQRILEKLDAGNTVEALKYASKLGLV
jgi:DNA-binding CsgD family transcriptional regulator